jgi:A/G-specific adenine glycosylase
VARQTSTTFTEFTAYIWDFYAHNRRSFMWRTTQNPYHIVVSELMLQQTQTYRVEPKFKEFIAALPTFHALAHVPLSTVLGLWQGLGYNRRGKYLHELAQQIEVQHDGILPNTPEQLVQLPGIGPNTAGSICAFAYNKPVVFVETNIRTVFLHTFFQHKAGVHDQKLLPLIERTLDRSNPREWYYALMDYGAYLKKNVPNPNRNSAHYAKQSSFKGSDRQIRGAVIRLLTQGPLLCEKLVSIVGTAPEHAASIIDRLVQEGLIKKKGNYVFL